MDKKDSNVNIIQPEEKTKEKIIRNRNRNSK